MVFARFASTLTKLRKRASWIEDAKCTERPVAASRNHLDQEGHEDHEGFFLNMVITLGLLVFFVVIFCFCEKKLPNRCRARVMLEQARGTIVG
jgi:hypothetical protein